MELAYKGGRIGSSGGTNFTVDSTLTLGPDKVLRVAIPIKELTQSEYDALSVLQKSSGLYFVYNDDTDSEVEGDDAEEGAETESEPSAPTTISLYLNGRNLTSMLGMSAEDILSIIEANKDIIMADVESVVDAKIAETLGTVETQLSQV